VRVASSGAMRQAIVLSKDALAADLSKRVRKARHKPVRKPVHKPIRKEAVPEAASKVAATVAGIMVAIAESIATTRDNPLESLGERALSSGVLLAGAGVKIPARCTGQEGRSKEATMKTIAMAAFGGLALASLGLASATPASAQTSFGFSFGSG